MPLSKLRKSWRSNKGAQFENLALAYLKRQGLKLLTRNYRCKAGEIDLIMQHANAVVFIEVRFRKNCGYGCAAATVTQQKQTRIIKTAAHFLLHNKRLEQHPCRFDVVAINAETTTKTELQINWIADAFM